MFAYPMILTPARDWAPDEGGFVVTCADLPELVTQGDDLEDAKAMARDALELVIRIYVNEGRPLPPPSPPRAGEVVVQPGPDIVRQARLAAP